MSPIDQNHRFTSLWKFREKVAQLFVDCLIFSSKSNKLVRSFTTYSFSCSEYLSDFFVFLSMQAWEY